MRPSRTVCVMSSRPPARRIRDRSGRHAPRRARGFPPRDGFSWRSAGSRTPRQSACPRESARRNARKPARRGLRASRSLGQRLPSPRHPSAPPAAMHLRVRGGMREPGGPARGAIPLGPVAPLQACGVAAMRAETLDPVLWHEAVAACFACAFAERAPGPGAILAGRRAVRPPPPIGVIGEPRAAFVACVGIVRKVV